MLCSKETTGAAFTVEHQQHRFTTRDTRDGTSEASPSNGSSPSASHVTNLGIIEEAYETVWTLTILKLDNMTF